MPSASLASDDDDVGRPFPAGSVGPFPLVPLESLPVGGEISLRIQRLGWLLDKEEFIEAVRRP